MSEFVPKPTLPPVIVLYGPPGAGKGTQTIKLGSLLPDYAQIDFGTILRSFVNQYANQNISDLTKDSSGLTTQDRALRIQSRMNTGQNVCIDDIIFVLKPRLDELFNANQKVIIQGPGRMIEEAVWFASYLSERKLSSCFIHLHIGLEDVIKRVSNRYFVPGSSIPYQSYEDALLKCPPNVKPERRKDDEDVNFVVARYRNQYKKLFAKILFIYQLKARSNVFIIDAAAPIEQVSEDIKSYLFQYYKYDNQA